MAIEFYIQIESPTGVILGAGPIVSASGWSSTARMDLSGNFSFSLPAIDPKASLISEKRRVRAFGMLQGIWTELGDGIIDLVDTTVNDDGTIELSVSGQDGSYELDGFMVPVNIAMSSGATPQLPTYALGLLEAFSTLSAGGAVWTFDDADSGSNTLYGAFYDESILRAVIVIAQKAGIHWRYDGSRTIKFFTAFVASGVRAIEENNYQLAAETCAITSLKKTIDTHELATGIYPYGSGQGNARFKIAARTRSTPAGYYATTSYMSNLDAQAAYGIINRPVDFKDIVPVTNSDADVTAAANALFDAGYLYLRRYSQRATTYSIGVEGCSVRLKPGQTIRVDYHDPVAGININEDLYIIEATTQISEDGVNTIGLVVSTLDAWPTSDVSILVDRLAEGKVYQAHPQLNANSYTTNYTKNLDDTVTASFRFRFGSEVTQIQSVLFEYQLLPFESTVRTIALASMTGGSGQLLTDGATGNTGNPSNDSSGAPSINASSGPSVDASGNPSTDISGAATGGTGGSSGGTGSPSTNVSGSGTGTTDPSTSDTGASTGGSGGPSTSGSAGPSTNSTGGPSGSEIESGGGHYHGLNIIPTTISGGWTPIYIDPLSNQLYTSGSGSSLNPETLVRGDHTHSMGSHTHSLNSHTHSLNNHTHSLNGHTHTLGNHTHDLNNHTHTLSNHTHDLNNHTHSLNSHTHTLGNHTHSLGSHTHSLNNHTHSLGNHTHTLTPTITTLYGIFREVVGNTYVLADLEYRVNSGSWISLSTSTSLGGGWYRIDITSSVYDSVSFRPLQESNVVEVRKAAASVAGKTVALDVQLSVRNIIQAIAFLS